MTSKFDMRRFMDRNDNILMLLLLTVLIIVTMAYATDYRFLRPGNIESITFMFPELGLLSIAMMIAMLTGGIDLSVIAVANLAGILAGVYFQRTAPMPGEAVTFGAELFRVSIGILIALTTGVCAGAFNGLLITRLKITPILTTLGSGYLMTGLAVVLTGGPAIIGFPALWGAIGNGKIPLGSLVGLPDYYDLAIPFAIFLVIACLVAFMLSRTAIGVSLMLIGSNPKAAVFAGLRTVRMTFYSYMLTGVLASIAGIMLSARVSAAKSDYGVSYLLQAVLIAVLGGTNPAGGRGTVLGVSIAVVALMFLSSGFQMLRFSNHLIDFIWGAFLLLVIALNALRNHKR
ncbi:ABC transporter permease [Microvirga sp. W0021]|uniref:ABC transporter permease n=1 Tax=Hohaiivirga grylli TaxID=3133970 RepID=A0ABV0BK09_9HYPH